MRSVGIIGIFVGLAIVALGFFFDTSVEVESDFSAIAGYSPPSSVINIGKLQIQELIVTSGLFTALAGVIFTSIGELIVRLEQSGIIQPVSEAQPFAHAEQVAQRCAWCDQSVLSPKLPCSAADRNDLIGKYPSMTNQTCRAAIETQGIL